jgi:hypothetical protein
MPKLCHSFSDREVSTMMLEGCVSGQWSMVDVNDDRTLRIFTDTDMISKRTVRTGSNESMRAKK